ncbi:MAG: ATP-binding protein [Oceanipulchritudo sp.]
MLRTPWRLVAYILIPLGILISLFGWRILTEIENEVEAKMVREVEIIGRALQAPIRRAILEDRETAIQEALDSVFTIGSVYGAFVYDRKGKLLARVGRGGDDPRYRGYIVNVLEGNRDTGEYVRFDDIRVYSAFIPVKDALTGPVGLIQINRDRSEIRSSMGSVRLKGVFISLGMILLSAMVVIIGHYVAQGKAISRLLRAIDRIEKGDRKHRADVSGPKEIATLGRALNRMMVSLNSAEVEIRERKAVEGILREQASRNARLMSLGKLAGGMAHELGAPLSVILGLVRRLKRTEETATVEDKRRWVSRLESEVRRTEAVVGQLLDFGNRRRSVELCDPRMIVEKALEAVTEDLEAQACRVEVTVKGTLEAVEADPFRLSLALRNLLSNAARHAPGGQIEISLKPLPSELLILVRDTGEGLPEGMENRIFEPFVSTGKNGHGLGLALVQQIVHEHRGIVRGGNWEEGAEFRMILPKRQPEGENNDKNESASGRR